MKKVITAPSSSSKASSSSSSSSSGIPSSSSSFSSSPSPYAIHRLRFADFIPSPIKAIAADLFSSKVAVGREDGDIEIYDSSGKWHINAKSPGRADFGLKELCWSAVPAESGRLFGISLRGFVFELDIPSLTVKNVRDSYGGAAWCMSASPRGPFLAIGCEDGAARVFSYDSGSLEYVRSLPTTGSRILSIAFHPVSTRLFLGCADGTIRCVDEVIFFMNLIVYVYFFQSVYSPPPSPPFLLKYISFSFFLAHSLLIFYFYFFNRRKEPEFIE